MPKNALLISCVFYPPEDLFREFRGLNTPKRCIVSGKGEHSKFEHGNTFFQLLLTPVPYDSVFAPLPLLSAVWVLSFLLMFNASWPSKTRSNVHFLVCRIYVRSWKFPPWHSTSSHPSFVSQSRCAHLVLCLSVLQDPPCPTVGWVASCLVGNCDYTTKLQLGLSLAIIWQCSNLHTDL